MLLPDNVYKHVPRYWIGAGILFLTFGTMIGPGYKMFPVYMILGVASIVRGIWVRQQRWKIHRRNEMRMLRSTQIIDHERLRREKRIR